MKLIQIASQRGAIAQLGERLPCTQEVSSSILLSSTILIFTSLLEHSHKRHYASYSKALLKYKMTFLLIKKEAKLKLFN